MVSAPVCAAVRPSASTTPSWRTCGFSSAASRAATVCSAFIPERVVLRAGGSLTWRFDDKVPHNVTFANGPRLTGSPGRVESTGPVAVGAHNEEVYCGRLGLSRDDLHALAARGIV